jgi:hypothetical protein
MLDQHVSHELIVVKRSIHPFLSLTVPPLRADFMREGACITAPSPLDSNRDSAVGRSDGP